VVEGLLQYNLNGTEPSNWLLLNGDNSGGAGGIGAFIGGAGAGNPDGRNSVDRY